MTREEILFQKFIKILNSVKVKPSDCIPLETVKMVVRDFLREIYTPKPLWISVKDDLPCNHKNYINTSDEGGTFYVIALVHSFVVLSRMEKFEAEWHWTTDEPTYWMPIPEPPKE